jgi:hypothetical protein
VGLDLENQDRPPETVRNKGPSLTVSQESKTTLKGFVDCQTRPGEGGKARSWAPLISWQLQKQNWAARSNCSSGQ